MCINDLGLCSMGPMVSVPSGSFMMGCNQPVDSSCGYVEKPYHSVYLSSYKIDVHEVTVEAYGQCVDVGVCAEPSTYAASCNWEKPGRSEHPVNCLTWTAADDYCNWNGKRLCTEAEWERAARGLDGRIYPWGNQTPSCSLAVIKMPGQTAGCGTGTTMAVKSKTSDKSPVGAYDMGGNVSEWVSDWYSSNYYSSSPGSNPQGPDTGVGRVRRGGHFAEDEWSDIRTSYRSFGSPTYDGAMDLGFRCCMSGN